MRRLPWCLANRVVPATTSSGVRRPGNDVVGRGSSSARQAIRRRSSRQGTAGLFQPNYQYPASISQRPSCTAASQARPSPVSSWNRARRRAAAGSHQRSDSGHGPDHPVIRSGGSPSAASQAGAPTGRTAR